MKTIADKDLGIECDYVATGDTEEEVMNDMNDHIKKKHPDDYDQVKTKISSVIKEGADEEKEEA